MSPLMAVVVLLTLANGISPYLEIKTAFSFNMYANLLTASRESNHFLLRSTLPLRDGYEAPVEILSTDDAGLELYKTHGYQIAYPEFRRYLIGKSVAVVYSRAGIVREIEDSSLVPGFANDEAWWSRFVPLRSIDERRPVRCQDSFLPAL
jgi:hypothetical protein